jgi:hypothetical protein
MNGNVFSASGTNRKKDTLLLCLIIAINLIIKAIPAGLLELGNDEVYYWTYALFPDWSHFDHPPMVGFLIQLFSLNLSLHGELFIRLGALILSSVNILILFFLVKRIYSRQSAWFAVLMYISSFYFNIISGLFILPDSPQVFFVLLSLFFMLPSITSDNPTKRDSFNILIFGLFTGLAFLSKYHSLFLWFGAGLYILFHNRIWLKNPALYVSVLITLILMTPVFYWNYQNHFISFTFHENRIGLFNNHLNLISFLQFNLGQIFYQNPILFIIYTLTLIKIAGNMKHGIKGKNLLLLYCGLPLILVFTLFSFFHSTLPHWTGPAFICLLILSSEYLAAMFAKRRKRVIRTLSASVVLFLFVMLAGTLQIKKGIIDLKTDHGSVYPGKNDFTLDMYGWKQAGEKFSQFLIKEGITDDEHSRVVIISDNWFPAAHIDYYIAHPLGIRLVALGSIQKIHKYYWINKTRKLKYTDRIFYLTDSRNYHGPEKFKNCFKEIIPADTLVIDRNQKPVKYVYIYDMIDLRSDSIQDLFLRK